jgi:geranylgeranyl diphosphate synthase, type I
VRASTSGTTTPAPPSLLEIGQRAAVRVALLLDDEVRRWSAVDPELAEPILTLAELVGGGGKRLRPAFCHWGYIGAGGDPADPRVVDAGAAFELLHAFALVHDDVMDGSDRRRGMPAAHRTFIDRHARSGWQGEARRFGEGVAILIGDLAFVYADLLMAHSGPAARTVYDELRVELNVGQYLDIVGTAQGDVGVDGARRIACYKSGKYTVERPLHVGAALAGRLDELAGPLSAYGIPLGEAFQLRDDVLGAFGDAGSTGKPVGDDLREGKPTPLLALARERATAAQARLLARVGDPGLSAGEVADLQDVLVGTGARDAVEDAIASLTAEAVEAVEAAPLAEEAQVALTELAAYVAWRDR